MPGNYEQIEDLKICDLILLVQTLLMLASGIQLEGWCHDMKFIWAHIILGLGFIMIALVICHTTKRQIF